MANRTQQYFNIYDSKAQAYRTPVFIDNVDLAIRGLKATMSQPNELTQFPEDFTLMHLGTFDPETGAVEMFEQPLSVINLMQLQAQMESEQTQEELQ